ncbi:hypothetical protein N784_13715, partial [Pontibacillus litoralis JSM 072002]
QELLEELKERGVEDKSVIDILRKRTMNHVGRGYSFEALRAKILFTQAYRKVKRKKKFKDVEVTFGKMLPDQFPNWEQTGYEWVFEEIYGADFSTLTKAMEDGSF